MSITYEAHATATENSASSITITKPTGLAVGDIMVAFLCASGAVFGSGKVFSLTGWTRLGGLFNTSFTDDGQNDYFVKIADSSDVAASNFTFSFSGGTAALNGSIHRLSSSEGGFSESIISHSIDSDTGSTTRTFTIGVTPGAANSMLLFDTWDDDQAATHSSYAVTTSNPTWTERLDQQNLNGVAHAVATATRPEVTNTGNATVVSTSSGDAFGTMISIGEIIDGSVTLDAANIEITANDFASITGDANVTLGVAQLTVTPNEITAAQATPKWTNTSKTDTSPTITNVQKS